LITKIIRTVIIGCLGLFLTSCWTPHKARAGYHAAAPMITALEKFHDTRGAYPTNLIELVPAYLPNTKALLISGGVKPARSPHDDTPGNQPEESNLNWFWYQARGDSYSLIFRYSGWYMHVCAYDSGTKKWTTSGYY
jgi:hypothetical protein